jgi:hypothetical protein
MLDIVELLHPDCGVEIIEDEYVQTENYFLGVCLFKMLSITCYRLFFKINGDLDPSHVIMDNMPKNISSQGRSITGVFEYSFYYNDNEKNDYLRLWVKGLTWENTKEMYKKVKKDMESRFI